MRKVIERIRLRTFWLKIFCPQRTVCEFYYFIEKTTSIDPRSEVASESSSETSNFKELLFSPNQNIVLLNQLIFRNNWLNPG